MKIILKKVLLIFVWVLNFSFDPVADECNSHIYTPQIFMVLSIFVSSGMCVLYLWPLDIPAFQ